MSMETIAERDPIEEYWAVHAKPFKVQEPPTIGLYLRTILLGVRDTNPWTDGSYALSAIVWGLILMLVWSLSI